MKKLYATLLLTVLPLATAHAAGPMQWRFDHDDSAGFLGVTDSTQADNPEAHYTYLMTCSTEDEWAIYVSDIDVKALGEVIAQNQQPTFTIATTVNGKSEESEPYYPDISYNQEESRWEYSSAWDTTILDHLAGAQSIRLKGTGLDIELPQTGLADSLKGFKQFCDTLDTGGGEGEGTGGEGEGGGGEGGGSGGGGENNPAGGGSGSGGGAGAGGGGGDGGNSPAQ
ncbi:MAG: hypothetical protein J0H94_14755 [Rhizobiales bacterium]|nr:hypothetical protein [Hyphomicrobiales bacterium]